MHISTSVARACIDGRAVADGQRFDSPRSADLLQLQFLGASGISTPRMISSLHLMSSLPSKMSSTVLPSYQSHRLGDKTCLETRHCLLAHLCARSDAPRSDCKQQLDWVNAAMTLLHFVAIASHLHPHVGPAFLLHFDAPSPSLSVRCGVRRSSRREVRPCRCPFHRPARTCTAG